MGKKKKFATINIKKKQAPLPTSDLFIVSFDISKHDVATCSVMAEVGDNRGFVNTIQGKKALELYKTLNGK